MKFIYIFTGLTLLVLFVSCKHNNQQTDPSLQQVFKFDNSLQCRNDGVALELMAQELIVAGIDVLCSYKSNDGVIRVAACDTASGDINVYQLNAANLDDAMVLGFKPVSEIPDYKIQSCN